MKLFYTSTNKYDVIHVNFCRSVTARQSTSTRNTLKKLQSQWKPRQAFWSICLQYQKSKRELLCLSLPSRESNLQIVSSSVNCRNAPSLSRLTIYLILHWLVFSSVRSGSLDTVGSYSSPGGWCTTTKWSFNVFELVWLICWRTSGSFLGHLWDNCSLMRCQLFLNYHITYSVPCMTHVPNLRMD